MPTRALLAILLLSACAHPQNSAKQDAAPPADSAKDRAAPSISTPAVATAASSAASTTAASSASAIATATVAAPAALDAAPPATRSEDVSDTIHGVVVRDPYRWLEEEKSPEVQAWMKAQDAYARARLAALPGREQLAARLKELNYLDSLGVPEHRGTRWFQARRSADREKSVVVMREGEAGKEKVLLDPNGWSKDGSVALGRWAPSWDGKKVAYLRRANNSDEATLYVLDVDSGQISDVDVIEGAKYADPSWTPKGDGFYYTWVPTDPKIAQTDRTGYAEIRFHALGADPKTDRLVRERTGDPTRYLSASLSRDGHWLVLTSSHGGTSTDVWFKDARKPRAKWTELAVGKDAIYEVWPWKDRFYLRTNEGAPRWRVLRADPLHPARAQWKELVPERKDATLDDLSIVGGSLSLMYLKDVSSRIELHALDGKLRRELKLPGLGSATNLSGLEDEDVAYFAFENFLYPREILRTSVRSGETSVYFKLKVPIDPSPYEMEQVFFRSKDGTRVPMFVVHRKDLKRDGTTPTLLTGYGGFQIAILPSFSPSIYAWLEQGGAWAVATLRGGSEYGEEWHRHGMLLEKQHVFDDFIGAAEKLISDNVTRPGLLAIRGGSNGGLLVGAAETQRPDLFGVVLCGVPLLDMIRYTIYGQAKTWTPEYGSAEDEAQFKALYAYSPLHHVVQGTKYPATLVLSADADDRVDPMHARKYAAALQAAAAPGSGPVLLRIEKHSGHGGADLMKAYVEKTADEFAFAFANFAGVERGATAKGPGASH